MSDFVIETENLTKKYKEQFCVEQLCLHVPRGKVYALLGRNVLRYEQKTGSLFRYL